VHEQLPSVDTGCGDGGGDDDDSFRTFLSIRIFRIPDGGRILTADCHLTDPALQSGDRFQIFPVSSSQALFAEAFLKDNAVIEFPVFWHFVDSFFLA
jgi:hypothetical protein